ncbi:MAG: GAF domain-containing protein [Gammaproteobacteria bacterium]|nr:MAG: GAF domain-containing protein [Gammaproteobacteria bacterium]
MVRFTQQVIIQIVLSAVIVIMFIGLHFATLHIESGKNWWGRSEDLELVFFSGLIATYVLLRAAALLKDGDYTRHIISAMVVTGLIGVAYLLELPHLYQFYSGEDVLRDVPLFDNIAFGYAVGLTAFTLLIMLMVGLWFSHSQVMTTRPTKALRISIIVIAMGTVAIVATTRWLIEHTLNADIVAMYQLDDAEHEIERIVETIGVSEPTKNGKLVDRSRFDGVKAMIEALIVGGKSSHGYRVSPLRDFHMIDDLKTFIYLIDALVTLYGGDTGHPEKLMDTLRAVTTIVQDVQDDIRISINNDRTMLAWSNYAISFILVMMFVAFSWLISRSWYAVETKNRQLELLVKKRTKEMRRIIRDLDLQVQELAANNAKISLLNECLAELRDHDYLYDEGQYKEFYKIILLNMMRVVNASAASYLICGPGQKSEHYYYGDPKLKEMVENLLYGEHGTRLKKMLVEEKVSLKIDNLSADRITCNDIGQDSMLKNFLGIPVIVGGELLGIMTFFNKEEGVFSDDDEILANIFSSHLGHVLERHAYLMRMDAEAQNEKLKRYLGE